MMNRFCVSALISPDGIFGKDIQFRLWPATLRSRFPPPIRAEACAMPTDQRLRLDDCQSVQNAGIQTIQPTKYQPVNIAEGRPLR
jgi:hypothetical protein